MCRLSGRAKPTRRNAKLPAGTRLLARVADEHGHTPEIADISVLIRFF